MIHPAASVDPKAEVDPTADIGAFAVVDGEVTIGPHCHIGPHVYLTGHTRLGAQNKVHAGCVLGDAPQDLKFQGGTTSLEIGEKNVFREGVTVHRSNDPEEATVIGSNNYFMATSHVGHNSRVGDRNVLANGALLGGHVRLMDQAFISAHCLVHQFVRIGPLALMQGGAGISKDLPPFCVASERNRINGLNSVGLRRAGYSQESRVELRELYRFLFLGSHPIRKAVEEARERFLQGPSQELLDFVAESQRGVCGHQRESSE